MNGMDAEIAPQESAEHKKSFFIGEDGTPRIVFYILLLIIIALIIFVSSLFVLHQG
jgi:hypothetical protein